MATPPLPEDSPRRVDHAPCRSKPRPQGRHIGYGPAQVATPTLTRLSASSLATPPRNAPPPQTLRRHGGHAPAQPGHALTAYGLSARVLATPPFKWPRLHCQRGLHQHVGHAPLAPRPRPRRPRLSASMLATPPRLYDSPPRAGHAPAARARAQTGPKGRRLGGAVAPPGGPARGSWEPRSALRVDTRGSGSLSHSDPPARLPV